MKKLFFIFLLVFPLIATAQEKPTVTLFHAAHCKSCLAVRHEFLPAIKEKYADKVVWEEFEIDEHPENLRKLLSVSAQHNVKEAMTPAVLVGNVFLVGRAAIEAHLDNVIAFAVEGGYVPQKVGERSLIDLFQKLSAVTVMGSGLIDGINPCAFAVIVFFVSFLAVYGYRRRDVIYVGTSYCVAVFITYLLIGVGFFKVLYSISGFYTVIKFFYYFVAGFCFLLTILALYDYYKYRKTGQAGDMLLQLPGFLKKRINLVIGSRLRKREGRGISGLIVSSLAVGFLVSLLEAVCTGQVYLPTIVFILKNSQLKIKAFSYLVLYNLMFIVPLVLVFILTLLGFSSKRFNDLLKSHLGVIKLAMAALFLFLGILIIVIS